MALQTLQPFSSPEKHEGETRSPSRRGRGRHSEGTEDQTDRLSEDDKTVEAVFYTPLSSPSKDVHQPSKEKVTRGDEGGLGLSGSRVRGLENYQSEMGEDGSPTSVDWAAMCSRTYTPRLGMLQRCCEEVDDRGEEQKASCVGTLTAGEVSFRAHGGTRKDSPPPLPTASSADPSRFSVQRRFCQRPVSWKRARRFGGTWRNSFLQTHASHSIQCQDLLRARGGVGSLSEVGPSAFDFLEADQSMPFILPSALASPSTSEEAAQGPGGQPGRAGRKLLAGSGEDEKAVSALEQLGENSRSPAECACGEDAVLEDSSLDRDSPVFESPTCDAEDPSVSKVFSAGSFAADEVARSHWSGQSNAVDFGTQSHEGDCTGFFPCASTSLAAELPSDGTTPGADVPGPTPDSKKVCLRLARRLQCRPATAAETAGSGAGWQTAADAKASGECQRTETLLLEGRETLSGVVDSSAAAVGQVAGTVCVRPRDGVEPTSRRSLGPGGWDRFEEESSEDSDVCSVQGEKWREHTYSRGAVDGEVQLPGRTRRSSLAPSLSLPARPGRAKCRKQDDVREGGEIRSENCAASFFKEWSEDHVSDESELDKEDRRVLKRRRFSCRPGGKEAAGFEEGGDKVTSELRDTGRLSCVHTLRRRPMCEEDTQVTRRSSDPLLSGSPPPLKTVNGSSSSGNFGASSFNSSCVPLGGGKKPLAAPSQRELESVTGDPLLAASVLSQSTVSRPLRKRKRQSIGNASRLLLLHCAPPADEADIVNSLGTALTAEETQELRRKEEEERRKQLAERQQEEERRKAVEEEAARLRSQQKAATDLARPSAEERGEVRNSGGSPPFVFGVRHDGSEGGGSTGNTVREGAGDRAPPAAPSVPSSETACKTPAVQQHLFGMSSKAVPSSSMADLQPVSNAGGPVGLSQRRPRLSIIRSPAGALGEHSTGTPSAEASALISDTGVSTPASRTGAGTCVSTALRSSSVPSLQSALLLNSSRAEASSVWGNATGGVGINPKDAQLQGHQGLSFTQTSEQNTDLAPHAVADGLVPGFGTEALAGTRGAAPSVFTQGGFGGALGGSLEGANQGANPFAFQRGRGGRGAARGRGGRRR
ncbi:hypothetical protein CSUI_003621 [Cystoisospora suis]|uniref:Uncharacterized protein n=1 Tax=Cystoisospora suis TaxID=483139 RepID=A0A2C6L055_9APIC|nr:hypothetical protein CSUI_003621 [Cystoisospora suis]